MASMVSSAPSSCPASASSSSNSGMAVISLVFSGTPEPRRGRVGAECVQGLEPFVAVVGAPCGLAVDGDEVVPVRPQRRHPTRKAASEQDRIDPVDEFAQPALSRNAVIELREGAQEIEMLPAPGANIFEIIATGDRRADDQRMTSLSGDITRQAPGHRQAGKN